MRHQRTHKPTMSNWSLLNFLQNYTSPTTTSTITSICKILDVDLIMLQSLATKSQSSYTTYYYTNIFDYYLLSPETSTYIRSLLQVEYCDINSTILITNPEIITAIADFMDTYFSPNYSLQRVAVLYNTYITKLEPLFNIGIIYAALSFLII